MSRESKLAKNTIILSIGTFLPKAASFITLPILTAYLTQEEFGVYDLITVLVSLILPATTLQIQTAAFRYLIDVRHDEKKKKKIITNIFAFIIPVSILTLVVLYFCLQRVLSSLRVLICIYLFLDMIYNAAGQAVRGLAQNFDYSISAIISALGKMVFAIICVWRLGMGLTGATIALCVSDLLAAFYLLLKARLYRYIDIKLIEWAEIKELIKYSWPMVPNSMSMWVMRVSDRFVVTLFMGAAANAVYSVANKIPSLLTLAQSTFTMAWQENASIVSKDSDVDAYYSSMFKTMYNLMAGFLGLLIAATPILFSVLIRGDYEDAYYQMPILFLAMFFYSMTSYLGGIYVAYKDTKSVGVTTVAAAVCNLVVDVSLIKFIGLYAASGSSLISYLLLFIYRLLDIQKIVKVKYKWSHLLPVFCVLVIECALCFQRNVVLDCINLIFSILFFFFLNKNFVTGVLKQGKKLLSNVKRA